ncbi:hypothetical protein JXL19_04100 [bacterium]|nr:hypothetical protein [bacterium]
MEKKRRLGRGLDEVADLWLSTTSIHSKETEEIVGPPSPENLEDNPEANNECDKTARFTGFTSKTFSIFAPESSKSKGIFVTNLSLEMAKLGHGSCILDYEPNISPLSSIFGNLFQKQPKGDNNEDPAGRRQIIRLYGMPSIHLFSNAIDKPAHLNAPQYNDGLYSLIAVNRLQDSIIFLYHHDTLDVAAAMDVMPSNIVFLTRPEKESLLVTYAYMKTALGKNPDARIRIIMDEAAGRDEAEKAFSLLNQIAIRCLPKINHPLKFLGYIIHDQSFGISLANHIPLALSEESSPAKEGIARIAINLIKLIDKPD